MPRYETEVAAISAAKVCSGRLPGEWKLRVWNNLGWHWALTHGVVEVRPDISYGYTAEILIEPNQVGYGPWCGQRDPRHHFDDPVAAVSDAIENYWKWASGVTAELATRNRRLMRTSRLLPGKKHGS